MDSMDTRRISVDDAISTFGSEATATDGTEVRAMTLDEAMSVASGDVAQGDGGGR